MRRAAMAGTAALIMAAGVAAPVAAAGPATPVLIVAHTDFTADVSDFESNLAGCAEGTVVNGAFGVHGTPWGGVFNGDKEFTCAGGGSGFTVRLKARFGENGSTGSWNVTDGWGDLAGLKGSGSLVGIPVSATILDDVYTGTVR